MGDSTVYPFESVIEDNTSLEGSKQYRDRTQNVDQMKKALEQEKRDKELFSKLRKLEDLNIQAE
jgi:hypothetical protein